MSFFVDGRIMQSTGSGHRLLQAAHWFQRTALFYIEDPAICIGAMPVDKGKSQIPCKEYCHDEGEES
jgi:hypothetical protein